MYDTKNQQEDFSYGGHKTCLSIYADRAHLRAGLREDALAAGLSVTATGSLDDLGFEDVRPLGDIVVVDCPQVDAQRTATLSRLDERARRTGTKLIVSTTVDALDCVFSCMDQSDPLLLVDPNRADRVLALGQVMATFSQTHVRELSDDDRLMLLRLTEQVGQIAGQIERLSPTANGTPPASGKTPVFNFGQRVEASPEDQRAQAGKGELPDAAFVRKILRQRQLRARFFEGDLFGDPAWDMLLDLTAARKEGKRVSVTSLCIASGVPPTTALRWIGQMVEAGLFVRVCDDSDRRRAFIDLSEGSVEAMARYFAEIEFPVPMPV
ncbi:MarR family winged helix-turn-helix transcriptional regulator [Novosphingobium sp. 1949]|uniref:MarR family winged helix-turn-helix transcriptional regulator n=1 Tax=Novosphingobium organovorum TaxID=2930092 RepID=A0ABT0B9K6_9SPHN|nr:MarR family winged helix-turn-helix transcriptional regulator [Novosphingobium organovorum]MCJ2181760.1 MarR family winged helix-turn-helix transcriptional regulator [Novosphingobium organovorum]